MNADYRRRFVDWRIGRAYSSPHQLERARLVSPRFRLSPADRHVLRVSGLNADLHKESLSKFTSLDGEPSFGRFAFTPRAAVNPSGELYGSSLLLKS